MTLRIWRDGEGYCALVTPPHARRPWRTAAPMARPALTRRLIRLGAPPRDAWDATDEADTGRPAPSGGQATEAAAEAGRWRERVEWSS